MMDDDTTIEKKILTLLEKEKELSSTDLLEMLLQTTAEGSNEMTQAERARAIREALARLVSYGRVQPNEQWHLRVQGQSA